METTTGTLDELIAAAQAAENEAIAVREAALYRAEQERIQREIDAERKVIESAFSAEVLAAVVTGYGHGHVPSTKNDRAYAILTVDGDALWLYFDTHMGWTVLDPTGKVSYYTREQSQDSNDRGLLLSIARWRGF